EQSIELYTKGANLVKECLKELEETKGGIYKVKEELEKLVETKI
ncbi:MAG: exodeoxyribonuclease VII small subunit, partial [Clostridiales bacterium]|nr:exodeoxyribonuclease VII small subunit [Candidatus Apopatousia equi]